MELKELLMNVLGMNPRHYYNIHDCCTDKVLAERVRVDVYWNNCSLYVSLFYKDGERKTEDKKILRLLLNGDAWVEEVE